MKKRCVFSDSFHICTLIVPCFFFFPILKIIKNSLSNCTDILRFWNLKKLTETALKILYSCTLLTKNSSGLYWWKKKKSAKKKSILSGIEAAYFCRELACNSCFLFIILFPKDSWKKASHFFMKINSDGPLKKNPLIYLFSWMIETGFCDTKVYKKEWETMLERKSSKAYF